MFERYTPSARRSVFYARAIALMNEAPAIDSNHLLGGLIWESDSRARSLFNLLEIFPIYKGSPYRSADVDKIKGAGVNGPPLAADARKAVAFAEKQTDAMKEFWIDTEHLLLGILAEPSCSAAKNLAKAGINLESAQQIILINKTSRPEYRLSSDWAPISSPSLKRLKMKWLLWKYRKRGLKA